jgi:hypothetical protein
MNVPETIGEHRQVIHGLADELLDRLGKLDGLSKPHLTINDGILAQAFDISSYKIAADELVTGSGATLLFHALAVGVAMAGDDTIDAVFIESKSGRCGPRPGVHRCHGRRRRVGLGRGAVREIPGPGRDAVPVADVPHQRRR